MSAKRLKNGRAAQIRQRRMIDSLCRWFARNARDLPWRKRRTGYTALVSEAMLQQTQVSRVIDSYRIFMRRFPTLKSLAAADEQDVLAMWRGLGYYRRARNLHAATRMIVEQHGGRVPQSVESLLELPGVGRYTAGAIASIAFDQPEPIVDGNVQRVLTRVFGRRGLKNEREMNQWAWRVAEQLVGLAPKPGIFNEALMELGATVCLPAPAKPRCRDCQLARMCSAKRSGRFDATPSKRRAKPRAAHHHAVIVRHAGTGRILVEQRPPEGMWSNMWQVPTIETPNQLDLSAVRESLPIAVEQLQHIGRFQHATTHRLISFHVHHATCHTGARGKHWRDASEVVELPMSNPQRRIVAMARGSQIE